MRGGRRGREIHLRLCFDSPFPFLGRDIEISKMIQDARATFEWFPDVVTQRLDLVFGLLNERSFWLQRPYEFESPRTFSFTQMRRSERIDQVVDQFHRLLFVQAHVAQARLGQGQLVTALVYLRKGFVNL